jgi:hypothetical protein
MKPRVVEISFQIVIDFLIRAPSFGFFSDQVISI